jgi:hypothetical protein
MKSDDVGEKSAAYSPAQKAKAKQFLMKTTKADENK